jgi:hypothetical protein
MWYASDDVQLIVVPKEEEKTSRYTWGKLRTHETSGNGKAKRDVGYKPALCASILIVPQGGTTAKAQRGRCLARIKRLAIVCKLCKSLGLLPVGAGR